MRPAALLALVLAALPAFADDPFAGLKRLDRVELVDRDGDTWRGIVRSVVRGRLSLEIEGRAGLAGSIAFERASIRSATRLGTATEEELKAASQPPPSTEGFAEPERKAPAAKPEPPPKRPVLEAFPAGEWTAKRRDEIAAKDAYLRSAEEAEFLERFDEWAAALESERRGALRRVNEFFPEDGETPEETYRRLVHTMAVVGRELTADERAFVAAYERWQRAEAAAAASR